MATKVWSSQAEKIGYVPRSQQKALTESGLTSTNKNDKHLDAETRAGLAKLKQNDAEIDEGLDEISNSLDTLAGISRAMNEEVLSYMNNRICNSSFKLVILLY